MKIKMAITNEQTKVLFESVRHFYRDYGGIEEIEDQEIRELYEFLEQENKRIREEEQIKEWTTEGACCPYDPDDDLPF
ncbi:hypothetical protein ABE354_19500 [Brevibacillus laterosporus]|uniref:hypothetical protein n=1 Tax=Brevibacillus laterosporus TaxID=1465 RepID=UPI003D23B100